MLPTHANPRWFIHLLIVTNPSTKGQRVSICIVHRRVWHTHLMRFSSLTRAVDRTADACSLQTQAGALACQATQSAVQRSPPSVTHIMGYYSFNRPRRDGRLSWPCWLTDSGRRTHKVVKQPSISLVQDKEGPPARTDVLTIMLRHLTRHERHRVTLLIKQTC